MTRWVARIVTIAATVGLSAAHGIAQATPQVPDPGRKNLDLWVGAWTMSGFVKDSAKDQEHSFIWRLRGHRILGGRAVQTDQEWIRDGVVTAKCFELLARNRVSGALVSNGACDDDGGWSSTLVVKGNVGVEVGTTTYADGTQDSFTWTWTFSPDRMSVTAVCETQKNGTKWVSYRIKGTKAR